MGGPLGCAVPHCLQKIRGSLVSWSTFHSLEISRSQLFIRRVEELFLNSCPLRGCRIKNLGRSPLLLQSHSMRLNEDNFPQNFGQTWRQWSPNLRGWVRLLAEHLFRREGHQVGGVRSRGRRPHHQRHPHHAAERQLLFGRERLHGQGWNLERNFGETWVISFAGNKTLYVPWLMESISSSYLENEASLVK